MADIDRLLSYQPRSYPSLPGGEARFFTEELQRIRNAIRGLLEYLKTGAEVLTVATLPSASSAGAGARRFVSDANATTLASVVAGGGANMVPVYSDGTDWRIG